MVVSTTAHATVRVVFVHLIFIQYWKLKIKTSQSWFSMWSSKIENQKFVAKKGKIEHHTSIFWKSKTKNWKWPVSGFNFLFSISSSQDSSYQKFKLNKAIHVQQILQETVLLLVKSKIKIVFWVSYLWKTKLPTD